MFGQNEIRKPFRTTDCSLKVHSVWYTIQGEGPDAGRPAVFVRLSHCNLACHFCFVGNTTVIDGRGKNVKIKNIQEGDIILSFDEQQKIWVKKKVTRTFVSHTDTVLRITLQGDRKIFCTPDHPFLVKDVGWIAAKNLKSTHTLLHLTNSDRMRISNPMADPIVAAKVSASQKGKLGYLNIAWDDPEFRANAVDRMKKKNPMKDPKVVLKGFRNRKDRGKKTWAENIFEQISEGLPIKFVGDGKLAVGSKVPDFRVIGQKKLIEVWSEDHTLLKRDSNWIEQRKTHFAKYGYECLCLPIPSSGVKSGVYDDIRDMVSQYINNGFRIKNVERVEHGSKAWVRLAGTKDADTVSVHNLEVEDTRTYTASGAIVHNCDTQFDTGSWWSLESLVAKVLQIKRESYCNLVVLTGGEPLLQNVIPLVESLNEAGVSVSIETAGTIYLEGLDENFAANRAIYKNLIVCSPKTPKLALKLIPLIGAYKYIVRARDTSEVDGLPNVSTQRPGRASDIFRPTDEWCSVPVYVQPMDEQDPRKNDENCRFAAEICMRYGYRLSLQLHKIVGLD
jgi:7-carboxy-7-deazaguanine synthase